MIASTYPQRTSLDATYFNATHEGIIIRYKMVHIRARVSILRREGARFRPEDIKVEKILTLCQGKAYVNS